MKYYQTETVELETIQCNILLHNNYSIKPNKHYEL